MVKTKLTGDTKSGYVLTLNNSQDNFKWDVSITQEEILSIYEAIKKKLKL